ncbi:PsbP domain protein photosystem II reaction center PsbP family [Perilla frutescens var. hirtella]|uniref:PsbP domain protein photosystem II reaction center PsbP family n=1 Tax=Perilla frutescens var. hirtella TaxID=608512 RepID=A0AAD4JM46_PERFH|nr:PsbP domain protein photosystem II reaction center PsbP family [Perilla frutescens var. frutescens]KAH6783742.1 PsbP domain protein photosystem II reaction center PsbP family [Perilla frutescens var. hirtella]KAH6835834.1 PsbP domain protein photosystem II reaction center PsbP family [Perilla frutescens var. hirtella]
MAAALPTVKSHHFLSPNLAIFGNNAQSMPISSMWKPEIRGKSRKTVASLSNSSRPFLQNGILRRDLMFLGLSSSLSLAFPTLGSAEEEELKMDVHVDEINAYSYMYPTSLPSDKFVFKWVESRKPERYSSAAPLSPDARLRIVSERVDFIDNLIISVSIGPPNALFLKSKDKSTWSAKDVADSVLADKSALRVTSSQRLDESSVLDAHSSIVDSEPYWYYEYLVRKSPTKSAQGSNLYRHFVAATAEREGYLYSLNASTLSKQWDKMGPFLEKTVASFRLLPPTENYVPPYKDPWRFW